MNSASAGNLPLCQRVILVTGAGGGLGSAAARCCAEAGACVVLLDKAIGRLETVHDEIVALGYPQPAIYPLDLSQATEDHYVELARIIENQFGALHGLVHCAAEPGIPGMLVDVTAAQWDNILRVNLTAAHALTRTLLPLMQRTGDSAIVFTSDSSARRGNAYWGAYGVAKIALEGMARMWAEELASAGRVRVNVFVPGPIDSPIRRRTHPGERPGQNPPVDRLANRYVVLLGPHARKVTGQVIQGLDEV